MIRLRIRLGTLALLIIIFVLAAALLVQRRHESAMRRRIQVLENDKEVLQSIVASLERPRQIELKKTRPQLVLPSGETQDTELNQPGRR
jgi:hypothetical protein